MKETTYYTHYKDSYGFQFYGPTTKEKAIVDAKHYNKDTGKAAYVLKVVTTRVSTTIFEIG